MKKLLIILSIFIVNSTFGQQKCPCSKALENLINRIESDYPGFSTKTKDTILYNSFKKQLIAEANSIEQSSCIEVLKKYTSFFKDGHIWIIPATTENKKDTVSAEFVKIDIDKFLKNSKSDNDLIEGVWENKFAWTGEPEYKLGIIKTGDNEYTGFVITSNSDFWKPKELKFKLFADGTYVFYTANKTKKEGTYKIYENNIIYFEDTKRSYIKETSAPELSEEQIKRKVGAFYGFKIKELTDKTTLITLPSFDYPFVETINNLIEDNRNLIENSENLIIDIRGNSGGTGYAYQELLPYIMTNSIRWIGEEFLATQTLIDAKKNYLKKIEDVKEKQDDVKRIRKEIKLFKKHLGQFVNTEDSSYSIQEINFAENSPRNVVILIDKGVASSGEYFLLAAKQSKKVKTLGTVTYGGLDYGAGRQFYFGCPEYKLYLPTFRSLRLPDYPIDNIGIQPDIYLDETINDWIRFAVDYLEN